MPQNWIPKRLQAKQKTQGRRLGCPAFPDDTGPTEGWCRETQGRAPEMCARIKCDWRGK
jgi:hypothetical protein